MNLGIYVQTMRPDVELLARCLRQLLRDQEICTGSKESPVSIGLQVRLESTDKDNAVEK